MVVVEIYPWTFIFGGIAGGSTQASLRRNVGSKQAAWPRGASQNVPSRFGPHRNAVLHDSSGWSVLTLQHLSSLNDRCLRSPEQLAHPRLFVLDSQCRRRCDDRVRSSSECAATEVVCGPLDEPY